MSQSECSAVAFVFLFAWTMLGGLLILTISGAVPLLEQLPRKKGNKYTVETLLLHYFPLKISKNYSMR